MLGNRPAFFLLEIVFIALFIVSYSSNAISLLPFVFTTCMIEYYVRRNRRAWATFSVYAVSSLLYYLVTTTFLSGSILGLMQTLENEGFSLHFLFGQPGVWPVDQAYVPPYTTGNWLLLVYPMVLLGMLVLSWTIRNFRTIFLVDAGTPYNKFMISFYVFFLFAVIFNAIAVFHTAGLDYIVLFSWLTPVLAVLPLARLIDFLSSQGSREPIMQKLSISSSAYSRAVSRTRIRYLPWIVLLAIFSLGMSSIVNNQTLPQRDAELVPLSEVTAARWLDGKNLVVTSDLHFASTYVTVGGVRANHMIPLSTDGVSEFYYEVDLAYISSEGVNAYVVTRAMTDAYITHFIGGRTVPSPTLNLQLSMVSDRVFDNGETATYVF
jgi:hypothetical protein